MRERLVVVVLSVALFVGHAVHPSDGPAARGAGPPLPVHLDSSDFSRLELDSAVSRWSVCADLSGQSTVITTTEPRSAHLPYRVTRYGARAAGDRRCGQITTEDGVNRILVYAFTEDEGGRLLSCGDPTTVIAHEIGHLLGLDDIDPMIPAWKEHADHMMALLRSDGANLHTRDVRPDECELLAGEVALGDPAGAPVTTTRAERPNAEAVSLLAATTSRGLERHRPIERHIDE